MTNVSYKVAGHPVEKDFFGNASTTAINNPTNYLACGDEVKIDYVPDNSYEECYECGGLFNIVKLTRFEVEDEGEAFEIKVCVHCKRFYEE